MQPEGTSLVGWIQPVCVSHDLKIKKKKSLVPGRPQSLFENKDKDNHEDQGAIKTKPDEVL